MLAVLAGKLLIAKVAGLLQLHGLTTVKPPNSDEIFGRLCRLEGMFASKMQG